MNRREKLSKRKYIDQILLITLCLLTLLLPDKIQALDTATLLVQTCDDTGMPLENVQVTLKIFTFDQTGKPHILETLHRLSPANGLIWFRQIPADSYALSAQRPGFETVDSRLFHIESDELCQVTLRVKPILQEISVSVYEKTTIQRWQAPEITTGMLSSVDPESIDTVSEYMENIPGVLTHPETGHPRFSAQRTSDLGLYLDGTPLMDPADHRPALLPPAWFLSNVNVTRAGIQTDQDAAIGGNIDLESANAAGKGFSGRFQFSEIFLSETNLLSSEAARAFDYWLPVDESVAYPEEERLSDARYQLLLNGRNRWFNYLLVSDYRTSNRGFCSDYVADNALEHSNTWLKLSHKPSIDSSISVVAGYERQELNPDNQWKLRGLPAIETDNERAYASVKIRNRISSNYWYDVTLSGLFLSSIASPETNPDSFRYPYGLGTWHTDDTRKSYNLIFKGGRMTQYHVIETGIRINWMDIDIIEGFLNSSTIDGNVNYNWINEDSDFEFSLWGRDRWFVYDNLEIGLGIRWDRLNYLEESDYLSPRIYGVIYLGEHILSAGVERIVQSPGMGFVSDETVIPVSSDLFEPVTEPQLGFRWFGSYEYRSSDALTIKIGGLYTLLSRTVVMLPLESEQAVEVIMPISGTSGKTLGAFFDLDWQFNENTHCRFSYGFNRSRLPWGEDVRLAFVSPYLERPWQRVFFSEGVADEIPLENEITHAFNVSVDTEIPVLDIQLKTHYRVSSGLRYTRFRKGDGDTWQYDSKRINMEKGDPVHCIDIAASKHFKLTESLALVCGIHVENLLDQFQYAQPDPFSSNNTVDPYRMDNNSPRSITASMMFLF